MLAIVKKKKAEMCFKTGEVKTALRSARDALDHTPGDVKMMLSLAKYLIRDVINGKKTEDSSETTLKEASELLRKVIKASPPCNPVTPEAHYEISFASSLLNKQTAQMFYLEGVEAEKKLLPFEDQKYEIKPVLQNMYLTREWPKCSACSKVADEGKKLMKCGRCY